LDDENEARSQDATVKVRTWCKGLLDVFVFHVDPREGAIDQELLDKDSTSKPPGFNRVLESGSDLGLEFTFVKFTHRSIPDYLMSIIQDRAEKYGFNETILQIALSQC
jgi:hypothetical protein